MAVPFGFSVGDFIAGIDLIVRVVNALKDTGGASSEYQTLVQELEHLQLLLEQLKDLRPSTSTLNHVNAVRGLALTFKLPLSEFLRKVEKYKSTLGVVSSKPQWLGASRKAQWMVSMPEEVSKMRALITMKIVTVSLLLTMPMNLSLSKIETTVERTVPLLENTNQKVTETKDLLSQTSKEQNRILEETRKEIQLSNQKSETTSTNLLNLCIGIRTDIYKNERLTQSQIGSIQKDVARVGQLQRQRGNVIASASRAVQLWTKQVRGLIEEALGRFEVFSEETLRYLKQILNSNLEIYSILMRIQNQMPRGPSAVVSDCIRFEDALGRVRSLQYDVFRHWEIFDALLRHEFRNLPGELNVRQGQFHIVNSNRRSLTIPKDEWERYIFPGTNIEMSMVVSESQIDDECPRPGCQGRNTRNAGSNIVTCKLCNLQYTVYGEAGAKVVREYFEDSDIYKRAEIYGLFIIPSITYSTQSSGHTTTNPEDEDYFKLFDTIVSTQGGAMMSLYDKREMESRLRSLSELEVFKRVHVRLKTPVISARRSNFDAHAAAEDCGRSLSRGKPDLTVLLELLPRLSHENVLALQRSYKVLNVDTQLLSGLPMVIQRSIPDKLGKICYATSLGRWGSEVHWIRFWYQNKDSQWGEALRFLLVEAVLSRTTSELEAIKAAFSDKLYKNDLIRCLESELEGHGLSSLILAALYVRPPPQAPILSSPAAVAVQLHDLFDTTDGRETRESTLIEILTREPDSFIREVIHEYQKEYQVPLSNDVQKAVSPIVLEGLQHIINGAFDKDARDAALIHYGLYPKALRRVPEILISRLIRIHWDLRRRERVVGYYKACTGWPLERSIKAATDGHFRDFCLNLID